MPLKAGESYLSRSDVRWFRAMSKKIPDLPHDMGELTSIVEAEAQAQLAEGGRDPWNGAGGYWRSAEWRFGSKRYVKRKVSEGFGKQLMVRTGKFKKSLSRIRLKWSKSGILNITYGVGVGKYVKILQTGAWGGRHFQDNPKLGKLIFGPRGYILRLLDKMARRAGNAA